jgi:hypothetical protein
MTNVGGGAHPFGRNDTSSRRQTNRASLLPYPADDPVWNTGLTYRAGSRNI